MIKKRNDIADVAWGLGFMLLTWVSFFISSHQGIRGLLVGILVSIWGIRLAYHIHSRNKGKAEDYRYLAWRNEWGKWFYIRSYFQVYFLQSLFLLLIILPVLLINKSNDAALIWVDALGILVWIVGFYFEAIGDAQLASFIKDPANKGKLMQSGLWAFTRHPNYFGEVMQWWGIGIIALGVKDGWIGLIGPITITYLILKVSGIPMLEKKMELHPDFAHYKKTTSSFIPWFRNA